MSQPLDLETVLLLHKLSFFVAALCFLYVRSQSPESVGLGFLSIGFFLVAASSTLVGFGKVFTQLAYQLPVLGNLAGLIGYSIFWIGICRISSQRRRRGEWLVLLFPVSVVTLVVATGWYTQPAARASLFQISAALLLAASSFTILSDRKVEPLPVRSVLGLMIAFTAFLSALVALGLLMPTVAYITPRNAFFVSIVCHFAIAVFVLALVKERAEAGLRKLANLDVLTGVPNRRFFSSLLPEIVRPGDAVVMIDIDHFKRINDGFGHLAGDEVLVTVARELSNRTRINDNFARFGGEEFVLFLPLIGKEAAMERLESMRASVSAIKHNIEDKKVSATLSMGLAVCEEKTCTPHALMKLADMALYASKAGGRDRLTLYSAEHFQENRSSDVRRVS